jgi:site-specific DNA-methyltransferase (adenine-specific)
MLKPYYENDHGKLYCGDCLEVMKELIAEGVKVDAVVTDPPYGIGFVYNEHVDDPDKYPDMMRDVIAATDKLVGNGTRVFWQGMLNADRWHEWFPKGFRLFAACKGFVQYRPTPVQFSWDPVVFWGEVKTDPSVMRKDFHLQTLAPFGAGRERVQHPCPRPLGQVEYVLDVFTKSEDMILDPFLGSGTTALAAQSLGRKWIGIEISPKYCDIAKKRLEGTIRQIEGQVSAFDLLKEVSD